MPATHYRLLAAALGTATAAAAVAFGLAGGALSSVGAAAGTAGLVLLLVWLRPWRLLPFLALRLCGRVGAARQATSPKGAPRRQWPGLGRIMRRSARRAAHRLGAGDTVLTGPLAWRPPLRDLLFRAHGWLAGAAFGVWLALRAGEALRWPFHATRFEALADVLASGAGLLGGAAVVLMLDRFPAWVAKRRLAGRIDGRAADAVLEFGASVMTLLFVLALGGLWAYGGSTPEAAPGGAFPAVTVFQAPLVSLAALVAHALAWLSARRVPAAGRGLWIVIVGRPQVARGFALPHLRLVDALATRWREGPVTVLLDTDVEARGEHALAAEQAGRQRQLRPTLPVEVGDWAQVVPPAERWTSLPVRELHPVSALMVPALKHWLRPGDAAVLIARSAADLAPWRDALRHTRCAVAWLGPQTAATDWVAGFAVLPVRAAGLLHDPPAASARLNDMLAGAPAAGIPPFDARVAQQAAPAKDLPSPDVPAAVPHTVFAKLRAALRRLWRSAAASEHQLSPQAALAVRTSRPDGDPEAAAVLAARRKAGARLARVLARLLEGRRLHAQPGRVATAPADPATPAPIVFVSYATAYHSWAQGLIRALQSHGLPVRHDGLLRAGDAWEAVLTGMLESSDAVVALVGMATTAGRHQTAEIERAIALGKRFMPVFVDRFEEPRAVLGFMAANVDASMRIRYLADCPPDEIEAVLEESAFRIVDALYSVAPASAQAAGAAPGASDNAVVGVPSGASSASAPSSAARDAALTLRIIRLGTDTLRFVLTASAWRMDISVTFDAALVRSLADGLESHAWSDQDAHLLAAQLLPTEFRNTLIVSATPEGFRLLYDQDTDDYPWEVALGAASGRVTPVSVIRLAESPAVSTMPWDSRARALLITGPAMLESAKAPRSDVEAPILPSAADPTLQAVATHLADAGYEIVIDHPDVPAAKVLRTLHATDYRIVVVEAYGSRRGEPSRPQQRPPAGAAVGVPLSDGVVLGGSEFASMRRLPELMFIDASDSGHAHLYSRSDGATIPPRSFPMELLRLGVRTVVAPAMAIDDAARGEFCAAFFAAALEEKRTIGEAVLAARRRMHERFPASGLWAAYRLYGAADYRIDGRTGETGATGETALVDQRRGSGDRAT